MSLGKKYIINKLNNGFIDECFTIIISSQFSRKATAFIIKWISLAGLVYPTYRLQCPS